MVACNTPVSPSNIAEAARPYASSREWSLLLEEIVELEKTCRKPPRVRTRTPSLRARIWSDSCTTNAARYAGWMLPFQSARFIRRRQARARRQLQPPRSDAEYDNIFAGRRNVFLIFHVLQDLADHLARTADQP